MNMNKYEGCKEYSFLDATFWYEDYDDILEDAHIVSIYGCEGEKVKYPDIIEGYPVRNICKREGAVEAHNCESAFFSDGIKKIWQEAFQGSTKLKEVTIPDSIEFMAYQSFADCPNLTKIVLPQKKLMAIPRAFQRSTNIKEIELFDTKETLTLEEALSLFQACINAVNAVDSGKANRKDKKLYKSIEQFDWMNDIREMM